MLLLHPIPRDHGFYPPLGSFDAALGPPALGQHQNSLRADKTHDPLGWGVIIYHSYIVELILLVSTGQDNFHELDR